jgi:hypothetical protein
MKLFQMMTLHALILSVFIPGSFGAPLIRYLNDYDPLVDDISEKYQAGAYLIYDCQEKHWVCVLQDDFKTCEEKRAKDNLSESYLHTCAPIGEFPNKKSCFQRQLFLTTHNYGARFCVKDYWKAKALEY